VGEGGEGRSAPTREPHLRVLGAPRRSLFDAVRPSHVQAAGERLRGPGGMALAALQHDGVTGGAHTPADAVVLGGRAFGSPRPGWVQVEEGRALGVAYGLAVTRQRRTAGGRTWCLLRIRALQDGRALEAAVAVGALEPAKLTPVVVGPAAAGDRVAALLGACGLQVHRADNDDAWSVLSALDHAARAAESVPVAVVAVRAAAR
jgi:hypothetical protein